MTASRLKQMYFEEILPSLMKKHQYKSIMQVPKIKKISINQGLGSAVNDKKLGSVGGVKGLSIPVVSEAFNWDENFRKKDV